MSQDQLLATLRYRILTDCDKPYIRKHLVALQPWGSMQRHDPASYGAFLPFLELRDFCSLDKNIRA